MSLDIFGKRFGVTGVRDVGGQTRPDAGKGLGKPFSVTGIRQGGEGCSCLTPPLAPDSIPMVYANQLTTNTAALQSH